MQLNPQKITYFAKTDSRGKEMPFGIKRTDRERHMYVIGKTGMGKSTLLENMAIQDIRNGEGMAFIDPHGGTAERIMKYVPEHRIKDVVYFAPFDMEQPIAFNVMEDVGYDKRHLVVSGLMSAFKKLWVDAWSARMEYILTNTLLALLEYEGSTLLDVNTMYTSKAFRKKVVDNIKDPIVKKFWTEEFANFTDRFAAEATPAIQNKVGQFTSNPLIRNIIGQSKSSFDLRQIMDERKILIINLSKGRVGDINTALLGSMLVTKIYLAAMSRADVSIETLKRLPPFYFYVDEFQNFANESFADILSEARKYKLNLLIAHQYVEQMEEEVRNAVFGNVGTTVAFRVGPFDAEVLETIFQPQFMATDIVNLGFAQIYLTLMIDGVGSPPFSATTLKPMELPPKQFASEVMESSRQQFGRPRAEIEEAINNWQKSVEGAAPGEVTKSTAVRSALATRPSAESAHEGRRGEAPYELKSTEASRERRPAPYTERSTHTSAHTRPAAPPPDIHEPSQLTPPLTSVPPPEPVSRETPTRREESPQSRPQALQPQHRPYVPPTHTAPSRRPVPEAQMDTPPTPTLDGAKSLKEALAQLVQKKEVKEEVSAAKAIPTPRPTPTITPPQSKTTQPADLQQTLRKITSVHPTTKDHTQSAPLPEVKDTSERAQLPPEKIREMLAVDEYGTKE